MSERGRAIYALTVLFAINTMNFFDRVIGGALGEPIRREWNLSDSALGALGTAFTLLYAFVGVPLGRLADRAPRKTILAVAVFVWSLLTAVSGVTRDLLAALRHAPRRRRRRGGLRARGDVADRRPLPAAEARARDVRVHDGPADRHRAQVPGRQLRRRRRTAGGRRSSSRASRASGRDRGAVHHRAAARHEGGARRRREAARGLAVAQCCSRSRRCGG